MSRRTPNPAADRAAQNQATIKTLLKLDGNKTCADCKRNKHPRWASWNLGVFVCIRCSGIHRGMGTHISRVKSVDLDAWTDEQLGSVLKWGNTRANKYWEAKLAPGHVPSEAKIENFIRTKYDSKRWVMDGPMPDPATLKDDADEDIPLSVVQQKQQIDKPPATRPGPDSGSSGKAAQSVDLFSVDDTTLPRPNTTEPVVGQRQPPPKPASVPPKQNKPGDSLLGLDFFGSSGPQASTTGRQSTGSSIQQGSTSSSRPDLKQSILSLYASAPRQAAPPPQPNQPSEISSTGLGHNPQSSLGGMNDAFSGLSFTTKPSPPSQPAQPSAFAGLGSFTQKSSPAASQLTSPSLGGGSFFDSTTKVAASSSHAPAHNASNRSVSSPVDFGAFGSTTNQPTSSQSGQGNVGSLFDLSIPPAAPPKDPAPSQAPKLASVFNLTSSTAAPTNTVQATTSGATSRNTGSTNAGFSEYDAWAASDPWSSNDPAPAKPTVVAPVKVSVPEPTNLGDFGWGNPPTSVAASGFSAPAEPAKISADEDFGGWSSAVPAAPSTFSQHTTSPTAPTNSTQAPSGGSEDLFSNVWG